MAVIKTDISEVIKTLSLLKPGNELVEIRMFDKKGAISGYFKDDYVNLLKGLESAEYDNCYIVLNSIKPECHSRDQSEKYLKGKITTTSDNDIDYRQWILIDTDPKRSSGIGSSDTEKEYARITTGKIHNYLRDIGFAYPICADSGNGYHLLYSIKLANAAGVTNLIKDFLDSLDLMFSDDKVSVDTTVFNPSRITKLYGTVARKGANTSERPHRLSRIVKVPDEIKITNIELIKKVADMLPKPEAKQEYKNYGGKFDINEFINKYLRVSKTVNSGAWTKYILEECPFNNSHKSPDSMVSVNASGAIGFKCLHNSCSNKTWDDLRELYEPKQKKQYDYTRTTSSGAQSEPPKSNPPQSEIKQYYQLHEIENVDRSKIISLPTGIKTLDKKIIGFNKKEVTVMSGDNSSGKSTIIGQLMLTNIENGFKCTLFSGELEKERIKNWLHLQAAGRQYNKKSEYGEAYFTPRYISEKIDEWVKGKLFIHNNQKGTNFGEVLNTVEATVKKEKTDIVYIDNLMALDISDINGDENQQQTIVIKKLVEIAKIYDIHIVFVCHPKKITGFLRKGDISGTKNLSNAVDNILMCHRVDNDFIKSAADFLGKMKVDNFLKEGYTNCIEVMKNRDLGVKDELIGLYFEPESKRLLNERHENIVYGWCDNPKNEVTVTDAKEDKDCPFNHEDDDDLPLM